MASAVEATCDQIRAELSAAAAAPPQRAAARSPLQLQQLQVRRRAGGARAVGLHREGHARQQALANQPTAPPAAAPQLVLHLVTSPFFRASTVTPRLLEHLAAFVRAVVSARPSARAAPRAGPCALL